jgi:hypothetical protein
MPPPYYLVSTRNHGNGGQWFGFLCGSVIFAVILSIGAAVVAGIAIGIGTSYRGQFVYTQNDVIKTSPHNLVLGAAGAPLSMTLPNDLTQYRGRTYRLYSATAQPHSVTIEVGALSTAWDGAGGNRVATLGGAVGDGLTFYVLDSDKIVVEHAQNVVFS